MKIALLGTRGVPANYSGFETCVEQLGRKLSQRGHQVDVYVRPHHINFEGDRYLGMNLIRIPTIRNKYLETFVHTFLSSLDILMKDYDIALYFIVGNSPMTVIPSLKGIKTVINVDGLDWKRDKWPPAAKRYLQLAEKLATRFPDQALTDSRTVQDYYREKYQAEIPFIPYGSELEEVSAGDTLKRFNLKTDEFVLFVGRLVPENRVEHLIKAFRSLDTEKKCVIVGDAPYQKSYIQKLKSLAAEDSRIVFTGYVFGKGYQELASNAYIFVEPSKASGTHPALIEAMSLGNCVIVNGIDENLETIAEAGFSYPDAEGAQGLSSILGYLIKNPDEVLKYREKAKSRARNNYSWETVTDQYEDLFYQLLDKKP